MVRCILIVAALVGSAAAAPSSDTVMLDGHVYVSPLVPMIGGSLHYEHRFADSNFGLTLRAVGASGGFIEGDCGCPFTVWAGLIGMRRHWDHVYGELELGFSGLRQPRSVDFDAPHGVEWQPAPDLQGTFGVRIGPIDVGLFMQIPLVGIGLRLGVAIGG